MKIIIKTGSILLLSLIFFSCTEKCVYFSSELLRNPSIDSSGTMISYAVLNKVYKKPAGISRFPDGGRTEKIFADLSLYLYFTEKDSLKKLADMSDIIDTHYTPVRDNFRSRIFFDNERVFYHISFTNPHTVNSSVTEKYGKYYSCDFNGSDVREENDERFLNLYEISGKKYELSLKKAGEILSGINISRYGIIVREFYRASDEEFKDIIINMECDEQTREIITEQIISKLDKEDIDHLISRMEKYKKELENSDSSSEMTKKLFYGEYLEKTKRKLHEKL